jgi:ketosteroid isomerase-like protein
VKHLCGIVLLLAATLHAEDSMSPLRTLVEAEKSFAQAASEHGIRESFLQFLANDSIIFDPAPTNGKKLYAAYDDKGKRLIWQPIFAAISRAGDVGVTTGPWEFKKGGNGDNPAAFGQFVSIWKKQRDNSWKVAVDLGIDNPQPNDPPGEVQLLPSESGEIASDAAKRSLEQALKSFADEAKIDSGAAVISAGSNDLRVFRDNSFPAAGKTAAKLMLSSDHGKMTRKSTGGGLSASSDLAYRYGSYTNEKPNIAEQGYFLSVWRLDLNRDWKLILDLQKKAPASDKPEK